MHHAKHGTPSLPFCHRAPRHINTSTRRPTTSASRANKKCQALCGAPARFVIHSGFGFRLSDFRAWVPVRLVTIVSMFSLGAAPPVRDCPRMLRFRKADKLADRDWSKSVEPWRLFLSTLQKMSLAQSAPPFLKTFITPISPGNQRRMTIVDAGDVSVGVPVHAVRHQRQDGSGSGLASPWPVTLCIHNHNLQSSREQRQAG